MSKEQKDTNESKLDSKKLDAVKSRIRNVCKQRGPLYIDPKYKRPGFVYRLVNDVDGTVENAMNLGYTPVKRKVPVGDGTASDSHSVGSLVTKSVGGGVTAILMEIPEELYNEIQNYKEEINLETEKSLSQTGIPTQTGVLDLGK